MILEDTGRQHNSYLYISFHSIELDRPRRVQYHFKPIAIVAIVFVVIVIAIAVTIITLLLVSKHKRKVLLQSTLGVSEIDCFVCHASKGLYRQC